MPQSGRDVVIVEAVRTPVGRGHPEKGYFKGTHANELLGAVFTEVIERAGIDPAEVEDVIGGCVQQYGEQMFNVTPNAWLQAGLPMETPATTVDRQCGSAQQAVPLRTRDRALRRQWGHLRGRSGHPAGHDARGARGAQAGRAGDRRQLLADLRRRGRGAAHEW